eukprot:COSAG02_NODE_5973_length_3901_cov_1.859811_2_plen_320_part_00
MTRIEVASVFLYILIALTSAAAPAGNRAPPSVCLGTGEYTGEVAAKAVTTALQLGYRCIDTAHEYNNQVAVGGAIDAALRNASMKLRRSDLFIISKVEGGLTAAQTTARLHADATSLGLGSIDLVLLHFPKALPGSTLEATIQEQWRAIAGFVGVGGAAAGGVSQFCALALAALDKAGVSYRPVLNQVGLHVGMGPDPQGVVSTTAARKDMQLMAYSPLAEASPQLLDGQLLLSIAKAHGPNVTSADVALRWLSQKQIPYAVAATNPVYQAQNLHAATSLAGFELSDAELASLDGVAQPAGCPFWPGSACWALTCNRTS